MKGSTIKALDTTKNLMYVESDVAELIKKSDNIMTKYENQFTFF